MPDRNRLVAITAPEKDRASLPTEAKLAAVINAASGAPLTAYVDTISTQPLLPRLPSPGAIATTSTNDALGITEWRLSNGVRVVLKPTTFKQDEILFRAVSPGGTSLASDADFIPAETASMVDRARRSWRPQPHRSGKGARRHHGVCQGRHRRDGGRARAAAPPARISRRCSSSMYLTFTAPRADPVAFGVLTDQLKVTLANQSAHAGHGVRRGARCGIEPEPSCARSR